MSRLEYFISRLVKLMGLLSSAIVLDTDISKPSKILFQFSVRLLQKLSRWLFSHSLLVSKCLPCHGKSRVSGYPGEHEASLVT